MASTAGISIYKNLSLCVYIGNTTTLNDKPLLNYCARFGSIISSSFEKEKFCDFRLIEFTKYEHLEKFLSVAIHQINNIILDVKLYKHILTNHDILNIERKFFIGPILNETDTNIIVQFYKLIDPTLHYDLSEQDKQAYLLFEFNNRQSVSAIYEKQTIPITIEHRQFSLHKPVHPKEFVHKIISMQNKQNQIHIHGLTANITEAILIDYFHKRAPVIACRILSNDLNYAVMEFNDERTVRKILDTPNVRLQGANLLLSKASRSLASLLFPTSNNDQSDSDEQVQSTVILKTSVPKSSISPSQIVNQSKAQETIQRPPEPFVIVDPIFIPSVESNESGWSSPPRTIVSHSPSIDQPPARSSSNPSATTTNINTDLTYHSITTNIDIKPIKKPPSSSILRFVEQFQNELDQIKDEYMLKFAKDRTSIEQQINLLVDEERQTFDKLNRYINDQRKRNSNKRKYSSSSSPH